jgi:hypothetical protein
MLTPSPPLPRKRGREQTEFAAQLIPIHLNPSRSSAYTDTRRNVRVYGFENVPMMPVAPLACPSNALMSSSRVMPGWSAFGSRSVAIRVKV